MERCWYPTTGRPRNRLLPISAFASRGHAMLCMFFLGRFNFNEAPAGGLACCAGRDLSACVVRRADEHRAGLLGLQARLLWRRTTGDLVVRLADGDRLDHAPRRWADAAVSGSGNGHRSAARLSVGRRPSPHGRPATFVFGVGDQLSARYLASAAHLWLDKCVAAGVARDAERRRVGSGLQLLALHDAAAVAGLRESGLP